eukprot:scaffold118738_cov69-Phaeocystis_antarctica.AAC.5
MSLPASRAPFMSVEALRKSAIACCNSATSFRSSATLASALTRRSLSLARSCETWCIAPLATPCAYTPRRSLPGMKLQIWQPLVYCGGTALSPAVS